jgi:hypothetical protein
MDLREVQTFAKMEGLYAAKVDGLWGPASKAACIALILAQRIDAGAWPQGRLIIGAGQAICRSLGIDAGLVDGYRGPQTDHAFEVFAARAANDGNPDPAVEAWRDRPAPAAKPPVAATQWPTQAQVPKFFGAVGANQTTLALPYPMRLAWDTKTEVARISCHKLVAPHFRRVFERTLSHYGIDQVRKLRLDLFGGCLNVRKMRGGSSWSMHAWGIAIDIDPANNALKTKAPAATLSAQAYDPFWGFVEAEGLVSLGRARNYDWMHFQAARL